MFRSCQNNFLTEGAYYSKITVQYYGWPMSPNPRKVLILTNKLLRFTALLMALITSALCFVGCGEDKNTTVDIGNISGNYQMIVSSADEINCDYLLVYRNSASYAELDSFVAFLEKLSAASSATFQICPDALNISDEKQKIILLGSTNYDESTSSSDIMKSVRTNNYYDYMIQGFGNTMSVSWVSKFGREDAFAYILNNLLPNGIDTAFKPRYSYLYLSDRSDTPAVTVDDINIVQYSVVMSSAPSYIERSAAERLVRAIKDATGVTVPLVTDNVEESKYEILIGDTNRGETYVTSFFATKRYAVAQYGSKLILRGGQTESTSEAVDVFADMVEKSSLTAEPLYIKANYFSTGNIITYGGDSFGGYELVFSDGFNSRDLDTDVWTVDDSAVTTYGDAPMLLYYQPDRVDADGNNLVISTALSSDGYVSGHVTSEKSFSIKYGYVEIKAKLRTANGAWVKMMLTNQNDGNETVSQIDVFNALNTNDSIFGSLGILDADTYYTHYLSLNDPKYEANRIGIFESGEPLNADEYHTYGVEWTPEYVRFFLDGVSYGTVELTSSKYKGINTEMYLDFIAGVNLTEEVAVDEEAMWPIDFCIDWVKVYQKSGSTFTDRKATDAQ